MFGLSSGVYVQVLNIFSETNKVLVTLPSGNKKFFYGYSVCTLGRVSNIFKNRTISGKAGVNVLLGHRPTVRGNAMNPVDHPHGGRTKTSQPELSP